MFVCISIYLFMISCLTKAIKASEIMPRSQEYGHRLVKQKAKCTTTREGP